MSAEDALCVSTAHVKAVSSTAIRELAGIVEEACRHGETEATVDLECGVRNRVACDQAIEAAHRGGYRVTRHFANTFTLSWGNEPAREPVVKCESDVIVLE
jgi:hypothetical protein